MEQRFSRFVLKVQLGIRYGAIYLAWAVLAVILFILLGRFFPFMNLPVHKNERGPILLLFYYMVIWAPVVEELIFRLIPIYLTLAFTSNKHILWSVIFLVSCIFGYLHGSWHHIFIQGFGGIMFSKAFLKGGLGASISAHMFVNLVSFVLIIINSQGL